MKERDRIRIEEEIFKKLDKTIFHYEHRYGWKITSSEAVDMQRELSRDIADWIIENISLDEEYLIDFLWDARKSANIMSTDWNIKIAQAITKLKPVLREGKKCQK